MLSGNEMDPAYSTAPRLSAHSDKIIVSWAYKITTFDYLLYPTMATPGSSTSTWYEFLSDK